MEGWNPLMLCMIYEYCRGSDSLWKPYFDILPTEFSTPMFWSEEELLELKGTGAIDKIGKQEAEAAFHEKLWPVISDNGALFTSSPGNNSEPDLDPKKDNAISTFIQIFHRMGSLIMAYAFHDTAPSTDKEEGGDMDEEMDDDDEDEEKINVSMVPMADMLNHKTGHNNARLFHEKECLRMVAIANIQAGQQIYNTYGELCNADLLRKYGFVDVPNPHNIAEISGELVINKFTQQDEAGKDEKVEWLLEYDGLEEYFILEADGEIPEELIGCAKILMMPLDEFKETVVKNKKIPNTKLTVEVQKGLRELLESKLATYPSTAKRNAVIVRSDERDIVQRVLDKVKKWKPPTPVASSSEGGKHKGNPKGQHPNKGKKPYQKK
ncbi:hypothetical protein BX616_001142 [Lobosporangium transversale]|nr:hypothetical protein BX616_001142 [Lobosporangium transversale]